jgi:BetI-type transcriptional repressor, C-terminal
MPPHARPHHFAPGVDPGSLAIELIALMDGLQVQWLLAPERVDVPYLVRHRIESALIVPLVGGN